MDNVKGVYMKKSLLLLSSLLLSSVAWGRQAQTQAMLNVRTVNGTVTNYPYQLKFQNGDLTDNADGTMTVSDSTAALATTAIVITSSLQSGATFFVSSGTAVNFYASSATITNLSGTTTNDSACPTCVGAYLSSATVPSVASTGSNQYFTIVSMPLTAGDWDISGVIQCTAAGATVTVELGGIGTAAGNSSTGFVLGDTAIGTYPPTAVTDTGLSIPNVRASLSGTTTYYLKAFMTFTVATPGCLGRLSARRVR